MTFDAMSNSPSHLQLNKRNLEGESGNLSEVT